MKFYLCIDDTDNLDSIGTGTIAEQIREKLVSSDVAECSLVTRHQLYIHEDIPYTSHNSSMCFWGETKTEGVLTEIIEMASSHLDQVAAEGSDPGLCVLKYQTGVDYNVVINFGKKAKNQILTKEEAFRCAAEYQLHLSEHGGTGQGIIGALAGVGLRLFGSDGEIKAGLKNIQIGRSYTVSELQLFPELSRVLDWETKEALDQSVIVNVASRTKTVLYQDEYVLFVMKGQNGQYETILKSNIRKMGESFYE